MMRRAAVPLAFAVCFSVAPPCWSQRRPGGTEPSPRVLSIRGTLRFAADERGAEMIKVELKRFTGESIFTTFTGANGNFEFSGLSNGSYIVVVDEKGFEPVREDVEINNASRAGVYLYLRVPLEFRRNEPGLTVSARELALPPKALAALRKGMERLYQKKDFRGGVAQFDRTISEAPDYYEAYLHRGIAFRELQNPEEARRSFEKAIEVSQGRYAPGYFALSELLSDISQFAEAEAAARRGLALESDTWNGPFQLGRALLGLNRLEEAEKSLIEARTRHPRAGSVYLVLANVYIRGRNQPALLETLDRYLEVEPDGRMSANARAMRETVQRNLAKAGETASAPRP